MTAWQGSTRKATLPADWPQRREAVKKRAGGRCEHVEGGRRCGAAGTDCDHINDRDDHRLPNLQWLCRDHHNEKTAAQAAAARRAAREATRHRSTRARHPGLT